MNHLYSFTVRKARQPDDSANLSKHKQRLLRADFHFSQRQNPQGLCPAQKHSYSSSHWRKTLLLSQHSKWTLITELKQPSSYNVGLYHSFIDWRSIFESSFSSLNSLTIKKGRLSSNYPLNMPSWLFLHNMSMGFSVQNRVICTKTHLHLNITDLKVNCSKVAQIKAEFTWM